MKNKIFALALCGALSAPAMAVDAAIDLSSGSAGGGRQHVLAPGASFVDRYFFSLGAPMTGGLGVVDIAYAYAYPGATVVFDIGTLSASLWSDGGAVGSYDAGGDTLISAFGTGDPLAGSFQLAAGNYFFQVDGATVGATGGVYGWSANVSAVPEPRQYAMLMAGLGMLGVIARRRIGR